MASLALRTGSVDPRGTRLEWSQPPPGGYQRLDVESLLALGRAHEASWQAFRAHGWKKSFGRYVVSKSASGGGAGAAPGGRQNSASPSFSSAPGEAGPALLFNEQFASVMMEERASSDEDPTNRGMFTTTRIIEMGTVVCVSAGVCAPDGSINAFDLYREMLAQVMRPVQATTFSCVMNERLRALCPTNDEECDQIVAADPKLSKPEMRRALEDVFLCHQSDDHNSTGGDIGSSSSTLGVSIEEAFRMVVRIDRNCFFEGFFPLAAKFNHSCYPNCHAQFTGNPPKMTIRTVCSVPEGSELTISYLAENTWFMPTDQRRSLLSQRYGFTCMCPRCSVEYSPSNEWPERRLAEQRFAERRLEAMACPRGLACLGGFCFPKDDHRGGGAEALDGWCACNVCGEVAEEGLLDRRLVSVYNKVVVISRLQELLDASNTDVEDVELVLRSIFNTAKLADEMLTPGHWLSIKLHTHARELLEHLAVRSARYKVMNHFHAEVIMGCKIHALALLGGMTPLIPRNCHLMGQLCSSAMRALEAEAEVIKNLERQSVSATANDAVERVEVSSSAAASPERARGTLSFQETYADLRAEAQKLGRRAHQILHGVLHVY